MYPLTAKIVGNVDTSGLGNLENRNGFIVTCNQIAGAYPYLVNYPDELKSIENIWAVAQNAARNTSPYMDFTQMGNIRSAIENADMQIATLVQNYLNANMPALAGATPASIMALAELRIKELEGRFLELSKLSFARSANDNREFDVLSKEKTAITKSIALKPYFIEIAAIQAKQAMDMTTAVMDQIYPKKTFYFVKDRRISSNSGKEFAFEKGEKVMAFEQSNETALLLKSGEKIEIPLFCLTYTVGGYPLAVDPEEVARREAEVKAEAERLKAERERKEAEEKAEKERKEQLERERLAAEKAERDAERKQQNDMMMAMLQIARTAPAPAPIAPAPAMFFAPAPVAPTPVPVSQTAFEQAQATQTLMNQMGMVASPAALQPTVPYVPAPAPVPMQAVQPTPTPINTVEPVTNNKPIIIAVVVALVVIGLGIGGYFLMKK